MELYSLPLIIALPFVAGLAAMLLHDAGLSDIDPLAVPIRPWRRD